MGLAFSVLGTLQVERDGHEIPLTASKQRTVLASLLLDAGRVVSIDRLIDNVWGDDPGGRPLQTVQAYVARLRKAVGANLIVTAGRGYRLDLRGEWLDLAEFDARVRSAETAEAEGDHAGTLWLLREALRLWRGDVLSDVPSAELHRCAVAGLQERLLVVLERRMALEVELGYADEVVGDLHRLVEEHPLRERLWASLMQALYASGRQAEALATYRRLTESFADELGIDPSAELRELHQRMLTGLARPSAARAVRAVGESPSGVAARADRADRADRAPTVPRQLPGRPAGFVGRSAEIDRVLSWFDGSVECPTVVVSGPAGVGKTALAVTVGQLLRDRFCDGQLYVDLRASSDGVGLSAVDVLPRFLRSLGVPGVEVPVDPDEQAAAYRTRLADSRTLVVLDDAESAESIRPLLPSGGGCGVVVTGRSDLRSLVAFEGARRLALDTLSLDEAVGLLAEQVGAARLMAEPAATRRLARRCGLLPRALRLAGAELATEPWRRIDDCVAELDGESGTSYALNLVGESS